MKRRKWNSDQKLKIVLESLSDQIEISKLCNNYQISQPLYYHWREQLLQYGHQTAYFGNIRTLFPVTSGQRFGIIRTA